MRITFNHLKRQYEEVKAEALAAASSVLDSGMYILSREVEAFEAEWSQFCGVSGAAGVASGTDALSLALIASGAVRPCERDEVIVPTLSAGYTALGVIGAGGVPVFADIDPVTYNLDPNSLEKAITPRTRAIVPVHLYGQMADMNSICEIARRHDLIVIEDAAQAHGARLGERRAGSFGHAAAFSFYPTKNLGAFGDGGAVVSDDPRLIERVKELRQGGHPQAMQKTVAGRNSRLDEIQAALLRIKLRHLDDWNVTRQKLAARYRHALENSSTVLPQARSAESHIYHLFVVQHPKREKLREHLRERGIETMIHYPFLLHQQALFRRSEQPQLPIAERVLGRILSLPLYPQLEDEEIQFVIEAILDFDT